MISFSQYTAWGYLHPEGRSDWECIGSVSARNISKTVVKTWCWLYAAQCCLKQSEWDWSVDMAGDLFSKAKGFLPLPFRGERISLSCSGNKKTKQSQWGRSVILCNAVFAANECMTFALLPCCVQALWRAPGFLKACAWQVLLFLPW